MTLSVVCWKWQPNRHYHTTFDSRHVNILKNMVKRNLDIPHRFVCITDDPVGIDKDIQIVKLWKNPVLTYGNSVFPNCFRRLRIFSSEMSEILDAEILSLDLDTVIVSNITSLFDKLGDFKIWKDPYKKSHYNGSMFYLKNGTKKEVWENFIPDVSIPAIKRAKLLGSDQAWISHCLGPKEAVWTKEDGVYSFRADLAATERKKGPLIIKETILPKNAKIVFFHGAMNPWDKIIQQIGWVSKNYQ